MFKNIANFSYRRNGKEAFGFYLAYLFFTMLLGGLAGGIYEIIHRSSIRSLNFKEGFVEGFKAGIPIGHLASVLFLIVLSIIILKQKRLLRHYGFLVLAIGSGIATILIGSIVGLIPLAFLTTRENK